MRPSLLLLGTLVLLAGCGGSDTPTATPTPTPFSEATDDAITERLAQLTRQLEAARKAGEERKADVLEDTIEAIEQELDRRTDTEFADTGYDRAIDRLPLDEPPLMVGQFVTDDTHELVVRVDEQRFVCRLSESRRIAAVRDYYVDAERIMRSEGVEDFSMLVDGLRDTGTVRPLASVKGGDVELTRRGRDRTRCR